MLTKCVSAHKLNRKGTFKINFMVFNWMFPHGDVNHWTSVNGELLNISYSKLVLNVEIMSDAALKLCYCKLTVTRTDVYGRILLLLQHLENILFSCSQAIVKYNNLILLKAYFSLLCFYPFFDAKRSKRV